VSDCTCPGPAPVSAPAPPPTPPTQAPPQPASNSAPPGPAPCPSRSTPRQGELQRERSGVPVWSESQPLFPHPTPQARDAGASSTSSRGKRPLPSSLASSCSRGAKGARQEAHPTCSQKPAGNTFEASTMCPVPSEVLGPSDEYPAWLSTLPARAGTVGSNSPADVNSPSAITPRAGKERAAVNEITSHAAQFSLESCSLRLDSSLNTNLKPSRHPNNFSLLKRLQMLL
jgi:hypothetical protein